MIEQFNAGTTEQVLAIRGVWEQPRALDQSGAIHWFFADFSSGKSFGTDAPLPSGTELPEEVILFAQRAFA